MVRRVGPSALTMRAMFAPIAASRTGKAFSQPSMPAAIAFAGERMRRAVPSTTIVPPSIGSAPAIQIGSSTKNIELGIVGTPVTAFAADYDFGLIIKGTVTASGIYQHIATTGVEVGISDSLAPNMGVLTSPTTTPASASSGTRSTHSPRSCGIGSSESTRRAFGFA